MNYFIRIKSTYTYESCYDSKTAIELDLLTLTVRFKSKLFNAKMCVNSFTRLHRLQARFEKAVAKIDCLNNEAVLNDMRLAIWTITNNVNDVLTIKENSNKRWTCWISSNKEGYPSINLLFKDDNGNKKNYSSTWSHTLGKSYNDENGNNFSISSILETIAN